MAELNYGTTVGGFEALHKGNFDITNVTRIVAGSYTGDGSINRVINLTFTPKFVYVIGQHNTTTDGGGFGMGGFTTYGIGHRYNVNYQYIYKESYPKISYPVTTTNGFNISDGTATVNEYLTTYYYVAMS